jgi:hypothetical protein
LTHKFWNLGTSRHRACDIWQPSSHSLKRKDAVVRFSSGLTRCSQPLVVHHPTCSTIPTCSPPPDSREPPAERFLDAAAVPHAPLHHAPTAGFQCSLTAAITPVVPVLQIAVVERRYNRRCQRRRSESTATGAGEEGTLRVYSGPDPKEAMTSAPAFRR